MNRSEPTEAFSAARRRALIQDVLADLSGRSGDLLSFDQVRRDLQLTDPANEVSLKEIPLGKIVGSVGRYRDFNRAFLPREQIDAARWTRIAQLNGQIALPPIDVFQVGEVYFVRDGNHRVSVARARRQATISARVVEIPVRVPLRPDTNADDLILKAEYARFLEATSLDQSCPDQRIEFTRPGGYQSLLQHIEIHQFYTGLRSRSYPTLAEASTHWYQTVYRPVAEHIRASQILDSFPGRTEADLYLWISENRAQLQMRYGESEAAGLAVASFAETHRGSAIMRCMRRAKLRLLELRTAKLRRDSRT